MRKLSVGDCPLCSKVVWKFMRPSFISKTIYGWSINFKKRPYEMNEHGTHMWFLLTDGTRMRVAICKECLKNITSDQVKQIHADIVYTKIKAIEKDKRKHLHYKLFDRVRGVEVFMYAETEQEIINRLKEINGKVDSHKRPQNS